MKRFRDFERDQIDEGVLRSGSVAMYAVASKRHGDAAVRHYQIAKQGLTQAKAEAELRRKLDHIADAFLNMLDGAIETRNQMGSIAAQVTAASLLKK